MPSKLKNNSSKKQNHPNLRFLTIIFLTLLVFLGVAYYISIYSQRSSAAIPIRCGKRQITQECRSSGACCKLYEYYAPRGYDCPKAGQRTYTCAYSDACAQGWGC